MKWLAVLAIVVINVIGACSQDYIVTLNNERLLGTIERSARYTDDVWFLSESVSNSVNYTPSELKEMSVDNRIYYSIHNPLSGLQELRQLLSIGQINLFEGFRFDQQSKIYSYIENYKSTVFFIQKDSQVYPLVERTAKSGTKVKAFPEYIVSLKNVVHDQPDILKMVDETPFSKEGLIRLIEKYNQRFPSTYKTIESSTPIKSNIALELSIHNSGVNGASSNFYNSGNHPYLSIGAVYNISYRHSYSFGLGIRFSKIANSVILPYSLGEKHYIFDTRLGTLFARGSLYLRRGQGFRPKLILGLDYVRTLKGDVRFEDYVAGGAVESRPVSFIKQYAVGFTFGAGVEFGRSVYFNVTMSSYDFTLRSLGIGRESIYQWNPISFIVGYRF